MFLSLLLFDLLCVIFSYFATCMPYFLLFLVQHIYVIGNRCFHRYRRALELSWVLDRAMTTGSVHAKIYLLLHLDWFLPLVPRLPICPLNVILIYWSLALLLKDPMKPCLTDCEDSCMLIHRYIVSISTKDVVYEHINGVVSAWLFVFAFVSCVTSSKLWRTRGST